MQMSLPFCNDRSPIGVFDSGLGGLSVLAEIHQLLPEEKLIYIADSGNAPYGDKSSKYIRERSLKIARFLVNQDIKILVIACNTVTAETIELLRQSLDIPIIGLEPAIKPAVNQSKNGIVAVLATKHTATSDRLLGLTERYAQGKKVLVQACPGLVEKVESGRLNNQETRSLLSKYIQPLLDQGADTLILGCTHYPFLMPAIRNVINDDILLIETAKPVAQQLQRILQKEQLECISNAYDINQSNSNIQFFNSCTALKSSKNMFRLWKLAIQSFSEITSIKTIDVRPLPKLN